MLDLMREPDLVYMETDNGWERLEYGGNRGWSGLGGAAVKLKPEAGAMKLIVGSPAVPIRTAKLRWELAVPERLAVLGDHWERAYGDLEWRGIVPERTMPWYFLTHDGQRTSGYGVKTGPRAFCYWQLDAEGVTLTADVRCGSAGVRLAERELEAAAIVAMEGRGGESAFAAAQRFCRLMCDKPALPAGPVYGGNNWYYAYGNSSHERILADSRFMSSLAGSHPNRPYMIIDDGWQKASGGGACNGGPWEGNAKFPDMPGLAAQMKEAGVKPGIWYRPLLVSQQVPADWVRYADEAGHGVLDPSVPAVLDYVAETTAQLVAWGYGLLKHDFTTFDMLGQWGFRMKSRPHELPHAFRDGSRTTAEIILSLYERIAEASGNAVVIGCNTIGHLAAGLFELQRTGDDTSGRSWERTRYMGVNTLAFRMPQHGTFYSHDADCIGLGPDVPWELNRQWLQLLAASGTPLFVSADPAAATKEQEADLRAAFAIAAEPQPTGEPLDWLSSTCPGRWLLRGEERTFRWNGLSLPQLTGRDNHWWL